MNIFLKIFTHLKKYGIRSFKIYLFYNLKISLIKRIFFVKNYIRVNRLKKPDKLLGVYSFNIKYENINILKERFEFKNNIYFENKYSLKNYKNYDGKVNLKVLVFSSIFIGNSEKNIKSDFTINTMSSAENAGWIVNQYYGKSQQNSPQAIKEKELAEFVNILEKFEPQLLCIDSNSPINYNYFNYERLFNLKKKYNFKVLMLVPDFELRKLQYWGGDLVDFVLFSRPSLRRKISFIPKQRLICLPGLPYSESTFKVANEKKYDVYYSGSDTRQRRIFLDSASSTSLNVKALFGNRINHKSPDYELYKREIGEARMTFANGYVSKNNSLITGRFIESILSRCVCLYEDCLDLNSFFIPYLHYVPVSNVHEFVTTAQYLRINPEILSRISEEANTFYIENYSSKLFWNYIALRMNS